MIIRFINHPYFKVLTYIAATIAILTYIKGCISPEEIDLQITLQSKTDLFDKSVLSDDFTLYFDSLIISNDEVKITQYEFKIENIGRKEIGFGFYESVGLKLSNSTFLVPPSISSYSKEYFFNSENLKIIGDSIIQIPSLTFNNKDFFQFKFICKEHLDAPMHIVPFGNLKEQGNLKLLMDNENVSIFSEVVDQTFGTHFKRLLFYLFVLLSLLGIVNFVLFLVNVFKNILKKKQRKTDINDFKSIENYHYTKIDDVIFARYIEEGSQNLELFNSKLFDISKLYFHIDKYNLTESYLNKNHSEQEIKKLSNEKKKYLLLLKDMKKDGYVFFEEGVIKKDLRLVSLMQELLRQLKKRE
jgi:hypothetical protein